MYSEVGGRGGRTHFLLAVVVWPLTMHPFRGGPSFMLQMDAPPTFRRSFRFFHLEYYIKRVVYLISF